MNIRHPTIDRSVPVTSWRDARSDDGGVRTRRAGLRTAPRRAMRRLIVAVALAGFAGVAGCSSTGVGATLGGAAGAASGHGVKGAVGGAVVGGVIGHEVGKRRGDD